MDSESNITQLEQRYQILVNDFRAGRIDEGTFISEVDRLQFQDNWGRYWMLGAQTGTWHYYDGQTWHQADPRNADALPFMDDQGRYWQRGVKSGDWYYYHPDTGEWVKPGVGDELSPPPPAYGQEAYSVPYSSQLHPQSTDAGPDTPSQLDAELFQDDEGRYWAMGRKTGQWYFYDRDGWHPAQEFQPTVGGQGYYSQPYQQPAYQSPPDRAAYPPAQGYDSQPQQPQPQPTQSYPTYPGQETPPPAGHQPGQSYVVHPQQPNQQSGSPTQPIQIYITSPQGQEGQPQGGQHQPPPPARTQTAPQPEKTEEEPAQPAAPSKPAGEQPNNLPSDRSESGSWYYFDGKQWLKYSTGEPDDAPPPPPKMVIEQQTKTTQQPTPEKEAPKDEPVVAELLEDDEPPVEVVDVEVITVLEPEPEPAAKKAAPEPEPEPDGFDEPVPPRRPISDEVRPRRTDRPTNVPPRTRRTEVELESPRRARAPSEPVRPVPPRKRETAHEPTIIIPTGATASNIAMPGSSTARRSKPVRPASMEQQRRARENTMPMENLRVSPSPASAKSHRQMTQPMPRTATESARSDTVPMKVTKSAKEAAQEQAQAASPASTRRTTAAQPQKSGYTVGDVLRSLPSTVWTFVGGLILLLACAFGLILTWGWMQGDELNPPGLVAIPSLTPTLDAGPPDATPTPGPTPTEGAESDTPATPAAMTVFSSSELGYSVEYPENWEHEEADLCGAFSPSEAGLDRDTPGDAAIWFCKSGESDAAISDLLTEVLAEFPSEAETLNEGTISIGSQTWTSAQIRFEEESLGNQGIATLAVTSKDGTGYHLVALAPADKWNEVQPSFQAMINSFSFSTRSIAQAETPEAREAGEVDTEETATPGSSIFSPEDEEMDEATPEAEKPKETATPLVYAVQSGDSLLTIANQFGVDLDLLASKNDIDDPTGLQIGQELVIPFTAEELEKYNEGQPAAQTSPSITEDATPDAGEEEAASPDTTAAAEAESAEPASSPTPAAEAAPVSGRIVYPAFNPGTNVYDVWMVDLASGEQNVVAAEASQPAFSKDGNLLAYRSWNLGTRGVFFRDFVGGRGGQVTRFIEDGLPTWSPDGFSFAFASRREGDRVARIYIGNQLGDEAYSIGFQGVYPATFPDGRLVVKGCTPSGDCGLFVMGATGGGEKKISSEVSDTAPAVSPDGSKIAFMSSARGATNWEIWVMNADGSNPQRLTENGSNEGLPAWSPDGNSIAYVSDQGGSWAVWAMNTDGSNQRKLFNMKGSPDGLVLRDIDNSKGWLEERISWAP